VRVHAEPERQNRLIHCKVCKEPLAATGGVYVLIYFLIGRAEKHNSFDLHMKKLSPKDAGQRHG
jgi:hypothetical protein